MNLIRPFLLSLFSVITILNEALRTTTLVQRPVCTATTLKFSSETSDDSSSINSNIQSNKDLFGGNPSVGTAVQTPTPVKSVIQVEKYKDEAQRLRKEAAEMEVSLREEARAKGLSEDMINKLIPLRSAAAPVAAVSSSPVQEEIPKEKFLATEVRSKLGYLNTGDAVRMTSELDRIKGRGFIRLWNSKEFAVGTKFQSSVTQLTSRTGIEPVKLRLDDVGYNYQNVFVAALVIATVFGLGSSFIGGQLGFILGYLSALFPITLVGLGSIAPALLGDIINKSRYLLDSEAKQKYVKMNAGKFLAGYILGLPIARFNRGGFSNDVEFFQIRPSSNAIEDKQMFARNKFKQPDIARSSVVCLAGSVAECINYGEASGTNANDVNTLFELMNAVDPSLSPEAVQDHVRWSAVTAYEILNNNKEPFIKLVGAFEAGLSLEECIALLEGRDELPALVSPEPEP